LRKTGVDHNSSSKLASKNSSGSVIPNLTDEADRAAWYSRTLISKDAIRRAIQNDNHVFLIGIMNNKEVFRRDELRSIVWHNYRGHRWFDAHFDRMCERFYVDSPAELRVQQQEQDTWTEVKEVATKLHKSTIQDIITPVSEVYNIVRRRLGWRRGLLRLAIIAMILWTIYSLSVVKKR
jgi:hypothetical protein